MTPKTIIETDTIVENGGEDLLIYSPTYTMLIYYACKLNASNGKLLYALTSNQYTYYRLYSLSTTNVVLDEDKAYFDATLYQNLIDFINNQLIPQLNNESNDLLEKYGGYDSFENLMINETQFTFINSFLWDEDDVDSVFYFAPEDMVSILNQLVVILQMGIIKGAPHFIEFD